MENANSMCNIPVTLRQDAFEPTVYIRYYGDNTCMPTCVGYKANTKPGASWLEQGNRKGWMWHCICFLNRLGKPTTLKNEKRCQKCIDFVDAIQGNKHDVVADEV